MTRTLLMLLVACMPFSAISREDVRVNENDWPPYFFKGNVNEPEGLGKELLQLCLPKTGHNYHFDHLPIKRMWQSIMSGELDINIFSRRPDRETLLYFGKEPIFTASYRPVVRVSSSINITDSQDFDELMLGHLAGLKYSPEYLAYVEGRIENGGVHISYSNHSLMRMLLAGRIDVYVNTSDTVLWNAKRLGVRNNIKILDFDIRSGDYFVTLSKKSPRIKDKPGFLRIVDACLAELKENGKYAEILNRYTMQP